MKFIDSSVLKESGLGRVVLFYTKCKRVTPEIQRIANGLVSKWSRPIIKRSASYRDRIVPTAETGSQPRAAADRLNAILARAREEDKLRTRKNAVAIPNSQLGNYTVAPSQAVAPMRGTTSVDMDVQRRKANAERLRSLTRKVTFK
jgi:transcription factor SPN1